MFHITWQYVHKRVSMMIGDAMAPILRSDICNHRDDVARSAYTRGVQRNNLLD